MVYYTEIVVQENKLFFEKFCSTVLQELQNNMGHVGGERTTSLIRDRFYWPKMLSEELPPEELPILKE